MGTAGGLCRKMRRHHFGRRSRNTRAPRRTQRCRRRSYLSNSSTTIADSRDPIADGFHGQRTTTLCASGRIASGGPPRANLVFQLFGIVRNLGADTPYRTKCPKSRHRQRWLHTIIIRATATTAIGLCRYYTWPSCSLTRVSVLPFL
jgi:hypothetical protein